MTKLQAQLHRLYIGRTSEANEPSPSDVTRAVVLQITQPASWPEASRIWQGVQADLDLPAPAIAVSGGDAYQLWFSLVDAIPATQATAFADALRQRYAPDIPPERIQPLPVQADTRLPPFENQSEQWSAFVAPDLAPVFADTPWLDIPPNEDGQAELLSRLDGIKVSQFAQVCARLQPTLNDATSNNASREGQQRTPAQFLLDVVNDPSIAIDLRIEAAKALLQQTR